MNSSINNRKGLTSCFGTFIYLLLFSAIPIISILVSNIRINKGPETTAIIEQIWPGKGKNECYVSYSFSVGDCYYYGWFESDNINSISTGKEIKVKYQTNKPYNSKVVSITDN